MELQSLPISRSTIRVIRLLLLAAVLSNVSEALAQQAGPLPPGAAFPAGLSVTAQRVEEGSASLLNEFHVTGKLILPQVIEAATSSPEGGFVEYFSDDPNDDADRADIPKRGYARRSNEAIQTAGGGVFNLNFTIASVFYGIMPTGLDFAHFANGESISSDVVLVNLAATPIQPLVYFYGQDGELIDPGSIVDVVGHLEVTDFGALTLQSELPSLGEVTISTNGMGDLVTGSVKVIPKDPDSPIGGVLRFDSPGIGVAGVGASQPVRDAILPVRRQMDALDTGAALRNLSESKLTLTCHLMMGGEMLEEKPVTLPANGQTSMFISELFEHDTSNFTGSMRCTAPAGAQEFTGVAVEMDAMNGTFTTLPLIPLSAAEPDPPESNVVVADGRDWGDDPYRVNSAAIDGHRLTISVSFSGGCRRHDFTLVISKSFRESDPVQLPAVLAHDANGDTCEAYPTESHVFDLTLVRTRYRQFYGPGPGKVLLRIAGVPGDDLVYEFEGL